MKKHLLCTALGVLVLNTGASANIEYNLAVALTASYTGAALRERDEDGKFIRNADLVYYNEWETQRGAVSTYNEEEGSRIVVERISNREILETFIVEGEIDTTIRGWAIKLAISSDDGDEGDVMMYAIKGEEAYTIPFEIGIGASAEQYRYSYSSSYNENTDRSTVRESGSARLVEEMFGLMQVNEYLVSFASILNVNESLRFFRTFEETFSVWFPSRLQLNSIVGNLTIASDDEFLTLGSEDGGIESHEEFEVYDVIQGRMNASGGRLILFDR